MYQGELWAYSNNLLSFFSTSIFLCMYDILLKQLSQINVLLPLLENVLPFLVISISLIGVVGMFIYWSHCWGIWICMFFFSSYCYWLNLLFLLESWSSCFSSIKIKRELRLLRFGSLSFKNFCAYANGSTVILLNQRQKDIAHSLNFTFLFWLVGKEIQIKMERSTSKNSFMGFLTWLEIMMRKTKIPLILIIQLKLQPKYCSLSLTKMVMGTGDVKWSDFHFTYDFLISFWHHLLHVYSWQIPDRCWTATYYWETSSIRTILC